MKVGLGFWGGTVGDGSDDNLTKSCTMIQIRNGKDESSVLVDCGLWQGRKELFIKRNKTFSFKPSNIDTVVLTHAHLDHCGRIPILLEEGFGQRNGKGRIFSTSQTRELAEMMLFDAAKINKIEVEKAKRRSKKEKDPLSGRKWKKALKKRLMQMDLESAERYIAKMEEIRKNRKPDGWEVKLFGNHEVRKSMELFKCHGYETNFFKIAKDMYAKFYPSGHILGGAICVIRIDKGNGQSIYVGFSGDLGRRDGIILPAPRLIKEPLDYWVTESTYGAMNHPTRSDEIEKFLDLVRYCDKKKSKLLIPSFALERTQEVIYLLSYYMEKKEIPKIPIFLDSPLALKVTEVYADSWFTPMFKDQDRLNFNPFDLEENQYFKTINTQLESKWLAKGKGPAIIIAGSGMADAGRIRNHLKTGLSDGKNVVCIIGYAVPNTPARKIVDREPAIMMDGEIIENRARMEKFGSFSAHADQGYLSHYTFEVMRKSPNLKNIFINHGGQANGQGLKEHLLKKLPYTWEEKIVIPKTGEDFILS